jgi:membrane-bound lytic murein transglycosylase A
MKTQIILFVVILLLSACSKKPEILFKDMPKTHLKSVSFNDLPNFDDENFSDVLNNFRNTCKTNKSKTLYPELCKKQLNATDAKEFIIKNFTPYRIYDKNSNDTGMLTGYYEAQLHASLRKTSQYKYPLYETPKDLVIVNLASIYPELKHYRLRGRLQGNKLVPYYSREQIKHHDINASILCYCNSKIDRFFLEVQGSGIVKLDDNTSMYVGYDNQNGYKYKSIGKYLVKNDKIPLENISLQSIRTWLKEHPSKIDEVLNYNNSMVFFSRRNHGATGALGLQLTPKRSVAIDRKYIPLGSMLYLNAKSHLISLNKFVFAQDTGGAIKGDIRADYFLGSGQDALAIAGRLKAPLKLWIILPKNKRKIDE